MILFYPAANQASLSSVGDAGLAMRRDSKADVQEPAGDRKSRFQGAHRRQQVQAKGAAGAGNHGSGARKKQTDREDGKGWRKSIP